MAPGVKNPGGDPSEIKAAIRVQSVQRGRLARRDAKRRLGMRVLGHALAPPKREMPKPLLRTLTVRLVELNRLWDIDIIGQRFKAELVVQLAFEGGATDPDLSRLDFAGFPLDGFGRPTFRPSAAWFMEQVDFNNALEYKTLDKKVFLSGDDVRARPTASRGCIAVAQLHRPACPRPHSHSMPPAVVGLHAL